MSFRDIGRGIMNALDPRATATSALEFGNPILDEDPKPEARRGVKPRLETRRPMTARILGEGEFGIESISTEQSTMSVDDDGYIVDGDENIEREIMHAMPVTQSKRPKTSTSSYSQLASEIENFQKLVANLEEAFEKSGESPEFQWKSRILVRSAQDADCDIRRRLQREMESMGSTLAQQNALGYNKLNRDYRRSQMELQALLTSQEQRQQAEISVLLSQNKQESKNQEEFFDRVMREREQEVQNINKSMHKVNEIYEELAQLVDKQQELVEKVAETIDNSKTDTRSGLKYVQYSGFRMCGALSPTADVEESPHRRTPRDTKSKLRVDEDFKWTMPFETIGDDVKDVHHDIMNVAQNLMNGLQENMHQPKVVQRSATTKGEGVAGVGVVGCYASAFNNCGDLPDFSLGIVNSKQSSSREALLDLNTLHL